jgi:uncharacterized protein
MRRRHPPRPALRAACAGLALLFAAAALLAAARDVPPLTGRVNDNAHLLTAEAQQRIEQKLAAYEGQTGHQIAVLTVDSLDGEPIEDFSLRVVDAWKLGREAQDDGVLLLVAKEDRKMRVEVGRGLEANLTDLQTHDIQEDVIVPQFKANDYSGGIERGVDAIVSTLQGKEPQPAPAQPARKGGGFPTPLLFFFFFFVFPFSWEAIQRRSWVLYLVFLPFYYFVGSLISSVVGIAAAALWAIAFPILRLMVPKNAGLRGRRGGGGWWFPGGGGGWGSGGGGWSGGGGGGGGFSGGGGSFGGGGSSSSW